MAEITEKNYPLFKRMYQKAVTENKESFIFDSQEVLCSFAKYVVEFQESKRGKS